MNTKPSSSPPYTFEEYLEQSRAAEGRLEYHAGHIEAMAGAKGPHNRIQGDTYAYLSSMLRKQGGCRPYNSEQAVAIPAFDRYVYPDMSFVCEPEDQFTDEQELFLANPSLLIEVLSDGTEGRDRDEKLVWYNSLPSFREYVMIDSRKIAVRGFFRHDDQRWSIQNLYERQQVLRLYSLGIDLPLAEVYRRVVF